MELMRSRSFRSRLSNFGRGWLNGRLRASGGAPLKQVRTRKRLAELPLRSSNIASQPSVVDFLEVNAELPYTTVVEGLEEFLYQSELQAPVQTLNRAAPFVSGKRRA